ncbi:MAG: hypothetical protein JWM33_989 [Caulobacteraceae bacterium]|nr:hypothetical protein [Caulobacteraceae bacterium]
MGLAALAGGASGAKAWAAAKPPAAVVAVAQKTMRDEAHPRPVPPAAMFRAVDVSRDGVADWVIDFDKSGQDDWCGTGGCLKIVVASRAGRYEEVFNEQALAFSLTSVAGRAQLDIDIHGSNCGGFGSQQCLRRFVWDEAAHAFDEAPNRKGETRLRVLLLQNVQSGAQPARADIAAQARRCTAAGGKPSTDAPEAVSTPDLNGDRIRDWIIPPIDCAMPGDKPAPAEANQVMVSAAGGYRTSLSFPGDEYDIDIGAHPARIIQLVGDCERGTRCAGRAWTWNSQRGMFTSGSVSTSP